MPLELQIVTPERVLFEEGEVASVTITASQGEMTILPSHAPLMTELRPGPLVFRKGGEEVDVALSGGFLEVRDDRVVVLADTAERSDEIDLARAEESRQRAQDQMASREGAVDLALVMAAMERAQARVRVAERRTRRSGGGGAPRPTAQREEN